MSTPQLRPAERTAFCRGCDTPIEKGAPMVSFYSRRNRGQSIHICVACSRAIGELGVQQPASATESDGILGNTFTHIITDEVPQ